MKKKRLEPADTTPTSEDRGIFKGSIVTVALYITPLRRTTTRGDLLCVGYTEDKRIEIVFPGRRRLEAKTLETALDAFVRQQAKTASSKGIPAPHASTLRFPLEIEGVWRIRLDEHGEDEIERVYQFMAGQWKFTDATGQTVTAGESPIKRPITRMPIF